MRFDSYQPAVRCSFLGYQQGGGGYGQLRISMLSYQTIAPHTLALLKRLMEEPRLAGTDVAHARILLIYTVPRSDEPILF